MTNIKCKGNKEIDLLAINPETPEKYHVESYVSTSKSWALKKGDLAYFNKRKFEHTTVKEKIRETFGNSGYRKVLVVWDTEKNANVSEMAKNQFNIEVWLMKDLLNKLMEKIVSGSRDDVLRLIELMYHSTKEYWNKIFDILYNPKSEEKRGK